MVRFDIICSCSCYAHSLVVYGSVHDSDSFDGKQPDGWRFPVCKQITLWYSYTSNTAASTFNSSENLGTNIPSYSTAIQLPSYRLPGFTHVKNGDVVVFNVPPKSLNDNIDYPVDLKTNYIKRCIGIPGDVVEIRKREVFVNGKLFPNPSRSEQKYFIKTTEVLDANFFRKYDIVNDYRDPYQATENWKPLEQYNDSTKTSTMVGYMINTTDEVVAKFKGFDWVKELNQWPKLPEKRIQEYTEHQPINGITIILAHSLSLKRCNNSIESTNNCPLWLCDSAL